MVGWGHSSAFSEVPSIIMMLAENLQAGGADRKPEEVRDVHRRTRPGHLCSLRLPESASATPIALPSSLSLPHPHHRTTCLPLSLPPVPLPSPSFPSPFPLSLFLPSFPSRPFPPCLPPSLFLVPILSAYTIFSDADPVRVCSPLG